LLRIIANVASEQLHRNAERYNEWRLWAVSDIPAFLRMQHSVIVDQIYLPQNKKSPTSGKEWLRPCGIMGGRRVPWQENRLQRMGMHWIRAVWRSLAEQGMQIDESHARRQ
jgi:hypothetical protein